MNVLKQDLLQKAVSNINQDDPNLMEFSNQNYLGDCISEYSISKETFVFNDNFAFKFGLNNSESISQEKFLERVHPHDLEAIREEFHQYPTKKNLDHISRKYKLLLINGNYTEVEESLVFLADTNGKVERVIGVISNSNNERFYEQLDIISQEVKKLCLIPDQSVEQIFEFYIKKLEFLIPEMKASVLWVKNNKVFNLAAPSLPADYLSKIEGLEIGINRGSCGTAAAIKEKVIVEDIANDERWADFAELAKFFGFGACWSYPITNHQGEVIATFALYYPRVKKLDYKLDQVFERSTRLMALILNNYLFTQIIIENNSRHELINKATNDAIYDLNIETNQIIWGDGFAKMFGVELNHDYTISKEIWKQIILPADLANYQESFQQFLNNQYALSWEAEYRARKADRSILHIKEICHLIRDHSGTPQRIVGVLRDMTNLVYSNQKTRLEFEISTIFKSDLSLKKVLEQTLDYLCKLNLFTTGEFWLNSLDEKHINLLAKFHIDEQAALFFSESKDVTKLKKGIGIPGLVWEFGEPILFNDLQTNPLFVRPKAAVSANLHAGYGIPLKHADKIIGALMFTSRTNLDENLTEIKVLKDLGDYLGAEIVRKQQEEEMLLLFESAPEMMAITSPDGFFTKVNPAFCKVLEYSAEELTFRPFTDFLHPEDLNKTVQEYEETITGERHADNFVNRYITKSGKSKWISWSSSDVFGEDGFVFAFGRDVTAIKELEILLEIASKFSKVGGWEISYLQPNDPFTNWSAMTRNIFEVDKYYQPDFNSLNEFVHEDFKDEVLDSLHLLKLRNYDCDLKIKIKTAKGKERWIRIIGKSEFFKGKCTRIFGSVQDITEHKLLEIELQNSLNSKSEILESIGDAFYSLDSNWNITYWNRIAVDVIGMTREQVLGKNIWELFPTAIGSIYYNNFHQALRENKAINFEAQNDINGQWLDLSVYPSRDGLSIYFKDISEKKAILDKLNISNERFEKITEATNDAIWDWDINNNKIFWGNGFEKLFGLNFKMNEGEFHLWENNIHEDDREFVLNHLNANLENPESNNNQMEYRFRRSDGTYAYVNDRSVIIRNHKGKPIRMLGAITDISSRIEFQQSLLELNLNLEKQTKDLAISNKELEQFAYVASHDLQEPLRMVTSFLTQLEKKYANELDERAHKYIHFAVDGAKRMRQIILDLLDFSRVGKNEGEPELVSFNEIVNEVILLNGKIIEEKEASIIFDHLPSIYSHRGPILQVFHNVIGNALKYAQTGVKPLIKIEYSTNTKYHEIAIHDNGIGIDEEYFDKIFIIFQRLHNVEEYSGTGMGLAIVKKIMENLGGAIRVKSKIGEGSIFYLLFPKN